ncbi:unnamed protein product, partial [Ectocarpus sp. 12 AP-2014]
MPSPTGMSFVSPPNTGAQLGAVLHVGAVPPPRGGQVFMCSTTATTATRRHDEAVREAATTGDDAASPGLTPAAAPLAGGRMAGLSRAREAAAAARDVGAMTDGPGNNGSVLEQQVVPAATTRRVRQRPRSDDQAAPSTAAAREARGSPAEQRFYGSPEEVEACAKKEGVSVRALRSRSRALVRRIKRIPKTESSWEAALRELDRAEREEARHRRREQDQQNNNDDAGQDGEPLDLMWREALGLLYHIRALGITPNVKSVSATLNACGQAGQWQRCLELLGEAREWGTELNEASTALRLLREMEERGIEATASNYKHALYACCDSKTGENWEAAAALLRRSDTLRNNYFYGRVIMACRRAGQWQKALEVLREMPRVGLTPDIFCYDTVISVACLSSVGAQWKIARGLLREQAETGVPCSLISYNLVLSACKKAGRPRQAVSLLHAMRRDGCSPDLISYNTAISACVKRREWELALFVLRDMQRPDSGVKPNTYSYGSVITVCATCGEVDQAVGLFDEMPEVGVKVDAFTYNSVAMAYARDGRWRQAIATLSDMSELGYVGDVVSYTAGV